MFTVTAISGSPSETSRSRRLARTTLDLLERSGTSSRLIDLCALPADDLLGRTRSARIEAALADVAAADILVVSTPVYRASYSGLLKVFFDLFPQDALAGTVAIPLATGGGPGHALVIDHALRPLLASVGATVIATGVYGTDAQFGPDLDAALNDRVARAVADALTLSRQLSSVSR